MPERILVVDDEGPIADILEFNLRKEGYQVEIAFDGEAALAKAVSFKPDLIILDIMLPKLDGWTVCQRLRQNSTVPIIMLTAKDEETDKVLGLELGADDYVTKPFSPRELLARVRALLRRAQSYRGTEGNSSILTFGDLTLDLTRYEVTKRGKNIDLTLREFELLKFLALSPGRVFSRETLLEKVWGYDFYGDIRTVDVTVRRLREKLEDDPANPTYVQTKRGIGYFFRGQ
ncbi:MAG: two-component system, OmpR family, response regulator VicR [Bacillota bacterium]|jgi:two-component system response regulator VicR|nr:two-component system, OmpR family, response regulator VicR [Bacillota bacterium]MDK2882231.1 two-component system, OmpR family, response regulator VicR [Bacillota bacterium]MDK2959951.1 two-component system, OmpR family, response regulator VicR [Bacillota bacterium]